MKKTNNSINIEPDPKKVVVPTVRVLISIKELKQMGKSLYRLNTFLGMYAEKGDKIIFNLGFNDSKEFRERIVFEVI